MADSKEVAVKEAETLPAHMMEDMEEFAGAGVSDHAGDAAVPFMVILQKGSPSVNKKDADYVEGAEPGMFMNNATRDLIDGEGDGMMFVPSFYAKKYVEWVPRAAGGGYVATYERNDPILATAVGKMVDGKAKGKVLPNGNDLVETDYYFGILAENRMPVILGLSSTGLKTSRNWQAILKAQNVEIAGKGLVRKPSFASMFCVKTAWQQNDSGDWYAPVVTRTGDVTDVGLYQLAREFFKECDAQEVIIGRPDGVDAAAGDGAVDIDGETAI